ncbi:hypothetical protein [Mycobacteroides abscessus]|uniref:hypothetical protein n=1 Tax=Mycobacteroides abscessus TaxID=36809 RepID=UPI000928BF03|nr:hypothetical protein [Mycobacteroides abscessus]SIA69239.1 Uncharacterised protein [Mycobacteroides abscessus subsp. abscessus]
MTAPSTWWTDKDCGGFVAPRRASERVTEVEEIRSGAAYCVHLTDTARAELDVPDWLCIDTTNYNDAERISQLIARLVAALRELGNA